MTADPRARRMLREYKDATAQSSTSRQALWDRIERSIDEGAAGVAELDAPEPPLARPRRAAVMLAVVLGTSAVAAVGLAPRLWGDEASPSSAPPAQPSASDDTPRRSEVSVVHSPAAPTPVEEPEPPLQVPASAPQRPARASAPPRAPTVAPPPSSDEDLREEMLLIARARSSVQQGRPAAALEALEEHLRRFPAGQMREDRAVLRVEALCGVGKRRQASIEIERFTRAFPSSAHLGRVRGLCPNEESIPEEADE